MINYQFLSEAGVPLFQSTREIARRNRWRIMDKEIDTFPSNHRTSKDTMN